MARRLERIRRLLKNKDEVQNAASCARALASMIGKQPDAELHDAAQVSKAMLTARVIHARGESPWPCSISRELDVEDPAFLPPLGAHLPLSARDASLLGRPDGFHKAWVDPWGWCGPEDGPSIAVWFGDADTAHLIGKLPNDRHDMNVVQRRSDDGHAIETQATVNGFRLRLFHWPVNFLGKTAFAMVAQLKAMTDCDARLGFAIRPADKDGCSPIFHLERNEEGAWLADGAPILSMAHPGDAFITSSFHQPDTWRLFAQGKDDLLHGRSLIRCPSGQASAVELYRKRLKAGETLAQFGIIAPPKNATQVLVRTSEKSLWNGAIADRLGTIRSGSKVDFGSSQRVIEAARNRLLFDSASPDLTGCMGVVALARLGFVQLAGERLGRWFSARSWLEHDSAILGWAATEFLLWTQERSWLDAHGVALTHLMNHLSKGKLSAGGHALFGLEGSLRWSEIWRVAALLNGVRVMKTTDANRRKWGLSGAQSREELSSFLGQAPWSGSPDRAPDGASAALLAAGWLNVLPLNHPCLLQTLDFLSHRTHNSGVYLHGGAHVAATAIWLALQQRIDPGQDVVSRLATLASPTGSLPTARHSDRGALGEGDDPLSAALFLLMALDSVSVHKKSLRIGPAMTSAQDLPTPFGRIDINNGKATGRFRWAKPEIVFLAKPN